jgi:hypothetical protein
MQIGLWLTVGVVVVGLPLLGKWIRTGSQPRCAFDGQPIERLYRVRVVDGAGMNHTFCCIRCAERWLQQQGTGATAVYVTDEAGGAEIDAATAHFVTSTVVTNRVSGNRVHAFRERADAETHARTFGGGLLPDDERPFRLGRISTGK